MKHLLFFFSLIFILSLPQIVSAHVLETDGSIGAVLHIGPADEPIAGEEASFFFEFKDTKGKFTPQNCDCIFSILENNQQVFSQPLFQNNTDPSLSNASVFYTFPKTGVYRIKVSGKPKTDESFEAFNLNYDIRVDKSSTQTENTNPSENWLSNNWYLSIIGAAIGGFLIFIIKKTTK